MPVNKQNKTKTTWNWPIRGLNYAKAKNIILVHLQPEMIQFVSLLMAAIPCREFKKAYLMLKYEDGICFQTLGFY